MVLKKCDVVPKAMLKEAEQTACFGTETVAFKFVIHHLEQEFKKIESPALGKEAVALLRKKIAPTHVVLTKQMEFHLGEWASGKRIEERWQLGAQTEPTAFRVLAVRSVCSTSPRPSA